MESRKRTLNNNYAFIKIKDIGWYSGFLSRIIWNGENQSETYTLNGVNFRQINSYQNKDYIIPMSTWLNILGIYLAEGTMYKEDKIRVGTYRIQIAAVKSREKDFIKIYF